MNNTLEKTSSSSLSVVEKKPERAGGCVGIFFQMFDWNRRLAKKKLFSRKLISPVRLKQVSKKFGGDGKQPKLRLIADENSGGFPKSNADNEQLHQETRAPGLVARLMGLDSMPALQRDKSKKNSSSSRHARPNGYTKDKPNLEKLVAVKHESRPQKLQRTSLSERQAVAKFGSEKLPPFKNVLSIPRKNHHPQKLPSPLISQKKVQSRRPSKLIGAASRILEPSSRLKCAITYTDSRVCHPSQDTIVDEKTRLLLVPSGDCGGFAGIAANGQSYCRNCRYLLNDLCSQHNPSEKPLTFASPVTNCMGTAAFCQLHKIPVSVVVQRDSGSQNCEPPEAQPFAFNSSVMVQSGTRTCQARGSSPLRPKVSNVNGSKNLNSNAKVYLPAGMESDEFEIEKRISKGLKDPIPPGRKRQVESAGFVRPKRNFDSSDVMPGKQLGYNTHIINGEKGLHDTGASFSYGSPVNSKCGIREVAERRNKCNLHSGERGRRKKLEMPLSLTGDALSALLQQKLKELNYGGDDFGCKTSRKTASMIQQELICALTKEQQFQEPVFSGERILCCNYRMLANSTSSTSSQANSVAVNPDVLPPLDSERPSPGSVLESFFSTESNQSTSLDESLGCKMLNNPDQGLSDSATFMNNRASNNTKMVIDIINHVSEILSCDILTGRGPKGNKLDQAEEALLNAELMLHTASNSGVFVGKGCPIKHLIMDELETLGSMLWMNFGTSLGIDDCRKVNQLKVFVFDCVIEYLEQRFGEYRGFGLNASRKLAVRMNTNTLIFEIVDVVRRWDELSRHGTLDELVERDLSYSSRDWTECGSDEGLEISGYLVEVLLDEVVVDLWKYCC